MSEEFRISVRLTKAEIARYNFHHIRWMIWLDILGFAALMVGLYFSITNPDPGTRRTLNVLVFWGVLLLAVGLSQPFIVFLQIYVLKSPAVESQMEFRTYVFDDTGIRIQSGEKSALMPWSRVIGLKDIGQVFLIFTSPRLAYVIPKRYFSSKEEGDRFKSSLSSRVESAK